ncbi:MAG: hypothetical protein GF308_09435 [Candidatus Heimdallarchaeota archaeon]|nr:hypothetical protein [Candidatus Heimdallarchaeota archaeon]
MRIEERTLYPPIIKGLEEIGFNAVGESTILKKHPDVFFRYDSISFVIEVKIGKPEISTKAIAQAYDYALKLDTQNIIILIYPEEYGNQTILDSQFVEQLALDKEIKAIVLTEYLTESLEIQPRELFGKLKSQIERQQRKIDFNTTIELIGTYVKDLTNIIQQIETEQIITEVVEKLDLFRAIGEFKQEEAAKNQVLNLAAYLLFNQLLFYHIYNKKTRDKVPDLNPINDIHELQQYFKAIMKIDYQSIYKIDITDHIPNKQQIIYILNEVIKAIKLLRAEHISQDLAGRFFHDLIPFEVRKILAAFYTHPIAAKILTNLTIDSYEEQVIDPACGSGTLLVSSYQRKMALWQEKEGSENTPRD